MTHTYRTGFTLIELLVVISIIALLIGILLPALSAARQQTRFVTCAMNMQHLGVGVHAFAADYKAKLVAGPDIPHWQFSVFGLTYHEVADSQIWITSDQLTGYGILVDGYINNQNAMFCPDDDTTDPVSELAKIGTADHAYGSYIYRNYDELSEAGENLDNLTRKTGGQASILAWDRQTLVTTIPNAFRTNHGNAQSNLLFVDGHVAAHGNSATSNQFTIREGDQFNFPGRLDQMIANGDHVGAGRGGPLPFP